MKRNKEQNTEHYVGERQHYWHLHGPRKKFCPVCRRVFSSHSWFKKGTGSRSVCCGQEMRRLPVTAKVPRQSASRAAWAKFFRLYPSLAPKS